MSGQLHEPAALPQGKHPVPVGEEVVWATHSGSEIFGQGKIFLPYLDANPTPSSPEPNHSTDYAATDHKT